MTAPMRKKGPRESALPFFCESRYGDVSFLAQKGQTIHPVSDRPRDAAVLYRVGYGRGSVLAPTACARLPAGKIRARYKAIWHATKRLCTRTRVAQPLPGPGTNSVLRLSRHYRWQSSQAVLREPVQYFSNELRFPVGKCNPGTQRRGKPRRVLSRHSGCRCRRDFSSSLTRAASTPRTPAHLANGGPIARSALPVLQAW